MKTFSQQGSERQRLPHQAFQFCVHISRQYGRFAIPALLAVFIGQTLGISNTYVLKELVDAINLKEGSMWTWAMIYLAVFAFSTISWRTSGYLGMHWITRARLQAARVLYDWLSQHSSHYFSDRFAGSLATKVTNASNGISHMLSKLLWDFLPTILRLVLSMVIAYLAKPILALILGGWAILFLILNTLLVKRKAVLSKDTAGSYTRLKGQMVDILTNIRVVHLFARRQAEIEHVDDHIHDFQRNIFRSWRYSEGVLLLNNALQVVLLGLMLVLTLRLLENGLLTVGEVIMVITLTWGILDALLFIGSSMNAVMESYGEVQEGLDEILQEHELVDLSGAPQLEVKHGDIHLEAVDFGYEPDKLVFQNFNLHIPAGQKVGLVGESGAGKTTLTQLLLRMYDVQAGAIYLDDQDISLYGQNSLREAISYVPQSSQLFHRSIRDNIGYGDKTAEKAEIVLAAERARAHHFVKDL
ncbi:MAG: ABC transporter ATP-binding protein, partial [Bacteroidota bacterium]